MKHALAAMLVASFLAGESAVSFAADENVDATAQAVAVASRLQKVTRWQIVGPAETSADFHGIANNDNVKVAGEGMMYPASNMGTLVAGVLSHALVNEAMKNGEKAKRQTQADVVLEPYRPTLNEITNAELVEMAAQGTIAANRSFEPASDRDATAWTIEVDPRFLFTQDQSAIVLVNGIQIYAGENESPQAIYRSVVRVVSVPRSESDLYDFWNKDSGAAIKRESAALIAESIAVVLRMATAAEASASAGQKTIRYMEGRQQKIERAQLLNEECGRLLLKTLRGDLMLVPGSDVESVRDHGACASAPRTYSADGGS